MHVRHSDSAQSVAENEHNLISQVVANELRVAQQDHSLWRYKQRKTEGGKTTLCDIVETDHGSLYRIVAINGQPLGSDAMRKEDARVREMVSNPRQLQDEQQKEAHDAGTARLLLQMIPDAFLYRYAGQAG